MLTFSRELAGQTVECPHCHLETILFVPGIVAPRTPEKVDARCPKCNSDNTVKCSMAWQSGTTTSNIGGIGIDLAGDVGFGGGITKSSTLLASQVAPPKKESVSYILVFILVVVAIVFLLSTGLVLDGDTDPRWPWGIAAFISFPILAFGVYCSDRDGKRREREHKDRIRAYLLQWVCLRCGTIYEPR
jgi:hypothetical protein